MSEWQDISTAPRDGTQIIGYGPIRETHYFREDRYWGKRVTEPRVRQTYMVAGLWQTNGFGSMMPTHWMPLPSPPETDK
jgi:hypothetical protein